ALEEWTVGDRMLRDMLRGMHPDTAAHAEWRRGTLPPGRLGVRKAKEIRERMVSVTYSKLAPKHALASWIGLVALAAEHPGRDWTALCIGRGKSKNRIATRLFAPPPVA